MPTYEYQCDRCHDVFEVRQRISEPALTTHDGCGGAVRRLLSPAPFILKGEGWYVTDYPSEARKKAVESEKSGAGKGSASGEQSSTTTSKETPTPSASTPGSSSGGTPSSAAASSG